MSELFSQSNTPVPVLRLDGDLDFASGPPLESALTGHFRTHRAVVIDLESVEFIDCAGLGVLLAVSRRAREAGRRVLLANPSPAVARLLALTRCDPPRPSVAEALDLSGRGRTLELERWAAWSRTA